MEKMYSTFDFSVDAGVINVKINNPPVNVLDVQLMLELRNFLISIGNDHSIKVIVFESANPEFFIAHVDMSLIDAPHAFNDIAAETPKGLNVFQGFSEMLRNQRQVTIVKLAGIARGGGAEFIAAADMCFASIEHAAIGQCEALMGILPGGGATQYLPRKLGRNRALEVVLGADLFDAETAERYGWVNRALPTNEIDAFVYRLAHNIARLPDGVIEGAKSVIPAEDLLGGFIEENKAWAELFTRPNAERLIRGGLAGGAQTLEGELRLEEILRQV